MRAGLAENTQGKPEKVLVIGNEALAKRIAQDLSALGLVPELEADFCERTGLRLASPGETDSLEMLRTFLESAKREIQGLAYVHPGVSAWADRVEFPAVCQELGLQAISPPARVVSLFSNKLNFLMAAEAVGVPHLVLSFDPIHSLREIEALIQTMPERIRFPFVLKSVRGGGAGIGVRVIHSVQDMERSLPLWLDQLRSRFGEAILFPERYLEGAHYVIQPFARFADGSIRFFPLVDASLQYRFRKLVEFCPATEINPALRKKLEEWSKKLADHSSFIGVGAFEFIIEAERGYLIEGLCRLNTGFHLWEKVAGVSAVAWQLATIDGSRADSLPRPMPEKEWAHSVSLRVHAEDPVLQIPQPGFVKEILNQKTWSTLTGAAEVDWSIEEGEDVSPASDGLLGLIFVGGRSRQACFQLAEEVLSKFWISGSLNTNERFILELIQHPWVRDGIYHAGFVDEEFIPLVRPSLELLKLAISISAHASQTQAVWTASGLKLEPETAEIHWFQGPDHWIRNGLRGCSGFVKLSNEEVLRVCAFPVTKDRWQVRIGTWWVSVRRWESGGNPQLYSLANGKVHSILYREGTPVPAHETIIMVESLQTLIPHAVPTDVSVVSWNVEPGDGVSIGQPLAELKKIKKGGP